MNEKTTHYTFTATDTREALEIAHMLNDLARARGIYGAPLMQEYFYGETSTGYRINIEGLLLLLQDLTEVFRVIPTYVPAEGQLTMF